MLDLPPEPPTNIPSCVVQAARDYSIPLRGLLAVWLTEGGRVGLASKNTNGTFDYGPMQINTVWAKELKKKFNIEERQLKNDFCISMKAAAYILRYEINRAGGSFWDGVGHYHSQTPKYKYKYINRVYKKSLKF